MRLRFLLPILFIANVAFAQRHTPPWKISDGGTSAYTAIDARDSLGVPFTVVTKTFDMVTADTGIILMGQFTKPMIVLAYIVTPLEVMGWDSNSFDTESIGYANSFTQIKGVGNNIYAQSALSPFVIASAYNPAAALSVVIPANSEIGIHWLGGPIATKYTVSVSLLLLELDQNE